MSLLSTFKKGLNFISSYATSIIKPHTKAIRYACKFGKYAIDNHFRKKVNPVSGSVVYSDLYAVAEHSGIHVNNHDISNIVVDSLVSRRAAVKLSKPESFSDSGIADQIYVSCDKHGNPVGNASVADYALSRVGDKSFYGLVYSNCHTYSESCLEYAGQSVEESSFVDSILDTGSDPTIRMLKQKAREKLGAEKWLLWDWRNNAGSQNQDEARNDIEQIYKQLRMELKNTGLNEDTIEAIKASMAEMDEYLEEISDENLPAFVINELQLYQGDLIEVKDKYYEAEGFIQLMGGDAGFSFNDLEKLGDMDLKELANELETNQSIKELVAKLGRNYISEEKKEAPVRRGKNEVFGIHKSNDLVRLLPSELSGIDDETLEMLFYAKFLESNLLTYELSGVEQESYMEDVSSKGPIVVSLDTSGSMNGAPLTKARALLFAISRILKQEKREMYVLLFGSSNEITELHLHSGKGSRDLLVFLSKGFNGGTDFETPLKRSVEIIENETVFENADVLMITDGYCSIGSSFQSKLLADKSRLGFNIYTVICDSSVTEDSFSDEVVSI